jgi:hypothetical protein
MTAVGWAILIGITRVPTDRRCDRCIFWRRLTPEQVATGTVPANGVCRRYPKYEWRQDEDACGEFWEDLTKEPTDG